MSVPALKLKDLTKDQRGELADRVLCAYDEGTEIADQAEKLGISRASLYRNLMTERPDEWRNTRSGKLAAELDETKRAMKDAKDHLELAKAEKRANRIAWELERLNPTLYGQKQEQQSQTPVLININLRGENRGRVVSDQPAQLEKEAA